MSDKKCGQCGTTSGTLKQISEDEYLGHFCFPCFIGYLYEHRKESIPENILEMMEFEGIDRLRNIAGEVEKASRQPHRSEEKACLN